MTKRAKIGIGALAAILLLAAGALWVRQRFDSGGSEVPSSENTEMAALRRYTDAIGSAKSIQVFEGLPHPSSERDLFEPEIANKKTFKGRGHYFYERAISPSSEDADKLRSLARDESSFTEWRAEKFCGGYHPDWLIRWTSEAGGVHELQLCLGCREAKFYGPDYQLHCDVQNVSYDGFKALLSRYTSQRPSRPKLK